MCPFLPPAGWSATLASLSAALVAHYDAFDPAAVTAALAAVSQPAAAAVYEGLLARSRAGLKAAEEEADAAKARAVAADGLTSELEQARTALAAASAGSSPGVIRRQPDGSVLEPADGVFDVMVTPGEPVQEAVDACPPGGCVLLLPGTHEGPLVLPAAKEVHVFGRKQATLQTCAGTVILCMANVATLDGLVVRQQGGLEGHAVHVKGGHLRLQSCDLTGSTWSIIEVSHCANPVITSCTIHDGRREGVVFGGGGTKGRLEGCTVKGNAFAGVALNHGSDPLLLQNKISDGLSVGVWVCGTGWTRGRLQSNEIFGNLFAGVELRGGANTSLVDNVIRNGQAQGVLIQGKGTKGRLQGNDVGGNAGAGIDVREEADPVLSANKVHDNLGPGIAVSGGGKGRMVGNVVTGNN